nr:uncharacterized protein LOC128699826 [Cherax quadricarinatus]XP_053648570.1 uncharacterized protein LOC128699826 [Cherax quadricarinatus]XP_053648571.1 uncharacterized protein LOC128699826 [Cherax quadricarinatus]
MEFPRQRCREGTNEFNPVQKVREEKNRESPWFNKECKEAKLRNKKAWKKYRAHGTLENKELSRRARNEYTRIRREAQKQYETVMAAKEEQSKLVPSSIKRNMSGNEVITLNENGEEVMDNDQEMCEEINERIQDDFTNKQRQMPDLEGRPQHIRDHREAEEETKSGTSPKWTETSYAQGVEPERGDTHGN